ncbi:MAG: carbohydrate ABC transporter permease [Candidatus Bathyarchaeia archaeon]
MKNQKNNLLKLKEKFIWTVGLIVLIVWALTILYPLLWTFFTSLKSNLELFQNTWGPPEVLRWSNYALALEAGNMATCFKNSLIVTAGSIFILFIISPMAAYALSKTGFWLEISLYILLAGMFIAPHIALVPMYILLKQFGIINTYLGLILLYVASGLPYCVFISRLGFLSIPKSLEESASIDGLSPFRIYLKICLPLALPTVLIAIILEAIFIWNDFLYPLVFIRSNEMATLPLGLVIFRGMYLIQYGPLAAGVVISMVPLLILYLLFSEKIKKGIAAGLGIKG